MPKNHARGGSLVEKHAEPAYTRESEPKEPRALTIWLTRHSEWWEIECQCATCGATFRVPGRVAYRYCSEKCWPL